MMVSLRTMKSFGRFLTHQGKNIFIVLIVVMFCTLVYVVFRPISFSDFQTHSSDHGEYMEPAVNGVPMKHLLPVLQTKPPHLTNRTSFPHNTSLPYDANNLEDDVTIVTAYFNLGRIQKGDTQPANFTPFLYHQWMQVFARVENPVIAYFELDEDIELFRRLRQHLPQNKTIINRITRSELWAFGILGSIRDIFGSEGYPKYHPGTVIPEYSAAMHAKYELVHRAIRENPYHTKYFSWLDIGLFRSIWERSQQPNFLLYVPPGFNEAKVAYGEVFNRSRKIEAKKIFILNQQWVCGCMFIGRVDTLLKWTVAYMKSTEDYIQQGFMNTDQQVVYSMANEGADQWLQVYSKPGKYEAWFHLGYSCMEEGARKKRRKITLRA